MAIDRTNFNLLVDDDGSGTTGTDWNKTQIQNVLLDPGDNAWGATIVTTTATGTQNNFAPGIKRGLTILRCNNATDLTITGFSGVVSAARIRCLAVGAGDVYLADNNGGSTAGNRILCQATSGNMPVSTRGYGELDYDDTTNAWRLTLHEQGAWIDYSATSTIVGWSAFTTKTIRYRISGRSLFVIWDIEGTSNSTATNFTLPFTAVNSGVQMPSFSTVTDNGTAQGALGFARIVANTSTVNVFKDATGAAWTNTGTKVSQGMLITDVQ